MNLIFSCPQKNRPATRTAIGLVAVSFGLAFFGFTIFSRPLTAQTGGDAAVEFKRISEGLSADRQGGANENGAQMEKAFTYLDSIALSVLNASPSPALEEVNRKLAGLASHTPPVGENYRLMKLGGAPPAFAMVINFGLGGPAAVRIYAGPAGQFAMMAKIDHVVQKDFFDSDVELASVSNSEPVFVAISGRTDDLSTGIFSAWKFDGHRLTALWNSDLLQQSSYEADETGFHLAYCSRVDEDHPSNCLKMSRDLYRYQAGEWKRMETIDLPPAKPASN
jgi:hypothetical protein